ncbi:MAG: carboxypeptidase regulatory-like domain-containing protein [Saprospiraceae bacterium]|nr:carboxypeptidase regulatory-like domain-containing protein [Saprospiraceae bacterium]MBK8371521.1 carboxypeptidase regulatory-like domain-containing protein [Saprospiraceae bacterium]MBK8818888.1 carboxypeptidase regulatory-like domain-containing protein [Saprospiraceae bacterium]
MMKYLFSLMFIFLCFSTLMAQTTIEGKVTDTKTGEPIMFGTVALYRGGVLITGTETDLDGAYFFSEVQPGTYEMEASLLGYAAQRVTGIVIKAGKTNKVDFQLSDDAILLDIGVEIKAYKVPLIDVDNTTQGSTVTAEQIRALPTKNVNAIAATTAGLASTDGGDINVRGSRSNETIYFIDGVRVTGNLIPQSEIEQLQVVIGGIEARYGDVTGGVISLTSKGPSDILSGGLELETSEYLDGFGYNLISGNLAGPIVKNKKKQTILGYRISGQYRNVRDARPSAVGAYRAPEDLINELEANPFYLIGDSRFPSLETVSGERMGAPLKARPNEEDIDLDLTARLDARVTDNIDIALSGNYNDKTDRFNPGSSGVSGSGSTWSLLNWRNNPFDYSDKYRGNLRIRHKIGRQGLSNTDEKSSSGIRNLSYTLTLGYEKSLARREDFRHEDNIFNYGYYGKTERTFQPTFGPLDPTVAPFKFFGHTGWTPDIGNFVADTVINPILAKYNGFQTGGDRINTINGLLNSQINSAWSNLYANVGQVYNVFRQSDNDVYTLNLITSFDLLTGKSEKGRHNIQIGFLYEQTVRRSHTLRPFGLWNAAETLANGHIGTLDYNNPAYWDSEWSPLANDSLYYSIINPVGNYTFYSKVRDLLNTNRPEGDELTLQDRVNVWGIDPDQLNLNMFSPRELIDLNLVDYYGYDYLGNKLASNIKFDDFFRSKDANGNRTYLVGASQPIYGAVFIQDKFSYKDIIFRLGLRMDYYDANTRVLRDPYALYEIENANDYYARVGEAKPESVGNDYSVYVQDGESDKVVAFRKADQWYLPNGTAVSGGNAIFQGGIVTPSYAGKKSGRILDIQNDEFDPNTSFVDYKPQINFMPRMAFSFPISEDAGFFAHYDVLYQRPSSGDIATALDYYNFNDVSRINPSGAALDNPNLKPISTIDYEVGFQQKLNNTAALKVAAYYKEIRNLIQQRVFTDVASPVNTYKSFDNIDFGTVKGFSFSFDRRRTNNLEITATYTLQFANGSGSDANSSNGINNRGPIRNLLPLSYDERHRITTVMDYRYESGKKYNGPRLWGYDIFADAGVNLIGTIVSGRPFTRQAVAGDVTVGGSGYVGSINGARLPWNYSIDLRIDKRFKQTINKESGKAIYYNVYFRVQNLLDTRNIIGVYGFSADPDNDGFLTSTFGQDRIEGVLRTGRNVANFEDAYNWRVVNAGNYTLPRRMYVGVILDF